MKDNAGLDRRTLHFGTVTASLSHDLGNILATVQQAAGLLDDYVGGAAEGEVIEVADLEPVLGRIDRSVTRGLEFVRLLNWMAHSIDQSNLRPDLGEVIEKAAKSARYFANQRCVEIHVEPARTAEPEVISAIDLHLLLFSCLRFGIDIAVEGAVVTVHVEEPEGGHAVVFQVGEAHADRECDEDLAALAESTGGRLDWEAVAPPACRFKVILPIADGPKSSCPLNESVDL